MNRSVGHRYRAFFSLLCWAAMLSLYLIGRESQNHAVSRVVQLSGLLLTTSFTLFTLVIWLADRRGSHSRAGGTK